MGGTNQETIAGLRMHVSTTEVHVHDDSRGAKFATDSRTFKQEVKEAIDDLASSDGIIRIQGKTNIDFCVGKSDGKHFAFLLDNANIKAKLQTFLNGI